MSEEAYSDEAFEPVAIVGMAGRWPGAGSPEQLWANVKEGLESISRFSLDELDVSPANQRQDETDTFVMAKGIIDGFDLFDPGFFGYLPKEAMMMDPQQRLFLMHAWEALEHAGCDPTRYTGSIGVYGGCYFDTYILSNLCTDPAFLQKLVASIQVGSLQTEIGNDKDYLTTRVSFKLGLRGPSVNIQTACSTSLVALCHAWTGLVTHQCDMALAGGTTLTLPLKKGYYHKEGGMTSRDGHCRAFDAGASGTVFSNGSAIVVLKRLEDAQADGNTIYAVIRGAATNNDGNDKLSYTAPSVQGQSEVIAMAHDVAGIDARSVGYVEAHGTGTPLGDPIEVRALTRAFQRHTEDVGYCALGSLKTNIGHLDVASGVSGVIKTAMSLYDKVLPPTVHFREPNPELEIEKTPFYVSAELQPWPDGESPRRAGVSSFGVGGTNAHVVLEEPPPQTPPEAPPRAHRLFLLSAKTETAFAAQGPRLADHLAAHPECDLDDIAYTLQVGRAELSQRRIVVADGREAAIELLASEKVNPFDRSDARPSAPEVTFMFPGQGAQFPRMGHEVYQTEARYRDAFDQCCEILTPLLKRDLRELLFEEEDEAAVAETLKETMITQPAIFAVEYALAQLWLGWGVKPTALVGHSMGEFAAATVAGVFALEDALHIVTLRGKLMQERPKGSMLSVRLPVDEVEAMLTPELAMATINAPSLCVVSGPDEAVDALATSLAEKDAPHSRLHTSHAFHSAMMDEAVAPTVAALEEIELSAPTIPILSTVTGEWLTDEEATSAAYWGRNLRQTVRFADAMAALGENEQRIFLEVGPGQTLATLAKRCLGKDTQRRALPSLSHPQKPADMETLVSTAGRLWLAGITLDWEAFNPGRRRVPLPPYPFDLERYWVEPTSFSPSASSNQGGLDPETEILVQRQLDIIAQQLNLLRHS